MGIVCKFTQIITAMTSSYVDSQQELSTNKNLSHSANCSGKLGGVGGCMEYLILAINDKLTSIKHFFPKSNHVYNWSKLFDPLTINPRVAVRLEKYLL